jgi:protein-S-isoprenylcysteine O-methyltransferase Ste14
MQNIEAIKVDYRKYLGSLIMLSFACIALIRWGQSKELFFLLLAFRDLIASFFLAKRESAQAEGSKLMAAVAYISSGLPLLYLSAPMGLGATINTLVADLFTIFGFLVVTWATIDLGTKLGVSPAKRGEKVTRGIYRFVGHPMYLGYAIAQLGWLFLNSSNIYIYAVAMVLFMVRIRAENRVLSGHH